MSDLVYMLTNFNFKRFIIIWLFIIAITSLWAKSQMVMYWDGFEYDEEILLEKCNVTPEEYIQRLDEDENFCPAGEEAIVQIGGMEYDWLSIFITIGIVSVIYNSLYFVYVFLFKRR